MSGKRALVVDDSKSARAFLCRLLEKHDLEVDAAESAEQAIDYLTRHTPDVIFMDHLMPGTDGFQAVQTIKNNPRTATIPILMYTSQEGELYLGQARALGAIGVLPKQIAPADVKNVLHQLKLIPDSRSGEPDFRPIDGVDAAAAEAAAPAEPAAPVAGPDPDTTVSPAVDVLLRDQIAEMRRFVAAAFDEQAQRVVEELSTVVREAAPPPPPPPVKDRRGWYAAWAAGLLALVFAGLWWGERLERHELAARLVAPPVAMPAPAAAADTAEPDAAALAAAAVAEPAAGDSAGTDGTDSPSTGLVVAQVPYGEAPFAGGRTERLRTLVADLAATDFRGRIDLHGHTGRFCLTGNATEGYSLAPPELPQSQCDLVGNPAEDGRQPRESVMFANAVTELRRIHVGRITIDVDSSREDALLQPYPVTAADAGRPVTAGDWNAAATANNRVVIRWSRTP
jgi:CheY-like chemotaxis protein